MAKTKQDEPEEEVGPIPNEILASLIGREVIRTLGTPARLLKVKVHPVGNDRYRVNVLVGPDPASARISDSFFLTADGKGNIVASSPKIVRVYGTTATPTS